MEKDENNINFERLSLPNELGNWPQLGLILKSCVCPLKWAEIKLNRSIRLGDISFRSYLLLIEKDKNKINFGELSLLNELSKWAQFGLILKSCVWSLKWAQVELSRSIRLGDISFRSYLLLIEKDKNNINFGRLSLQNGLSNSAQFGLILKSCVCSLKWAQVELNCSIRLGDMSFRSYPLRMEKADYGLYLPPTKKWKLKKKRSGKYFETSCHGSYIVLTTRKHNKSSSTPSLKQAVIRFPCAAVVMTSIKPNAV